jgi:hypothetical protein
VLGETVREEVRLERGSHAGRPGACLVELASLVLAGRATVEGSYDSTWTGKSDRPHALHDGVAVAVQLVHDRLDDVDRQRSLALLPQLVRAQRCGRPIDDRVAARLACWSALELIDLVAGAHRDDVVRIVARERDALFVDVAPLRFPSWFPGWNVAAEISWQLSMRRPHRALAVAGRAVPVERGLMFLVDLLEQCDKALVEEGALIVAPKLSDAAQRDLAVIMS